MICVNFKSRGSPKAEPLLGVCLYQRPLFLRLVSAVRNMAANCGRRTLQVASASAKTLLSRSSSAAAKLSGLASTSKPTSASRLSSLHKLSLSRVPVELGGALSLMPLHNVTASALFTSLLSLNNQNWGCLSEGFATPL